MQNQPHNLIIIGGGAAGLMAAITASSNNSQDQKVLLLEKGPKLGRKVLISGGGRCNVTNNKHQSIRDFLKNYPRGSKFLWGPFSRFSHQDTMAWFSERGLKLKTEEDGRVFPVSDDSADVMRVLEDQCLRNKVEIRLNQNVKDIEFQSDSIKKLILSDGTELLCKNLIIACGGMSYQKTGSSGDAYGWAVKAGHQIVPPKASLTGLVSKDVWVHELKGLALPEIELKLFANDYLLAKECGALLFTHWGVSGPGVFKITSLAAGSDYSSGKYELFLNLFPKEKPQKLKESLRQSLRQTWRENPRRRTKNCLDKMFPERLQETILSFVFLNPEKTCAEISNSELEQIVEHLTNLKINIAGICPSGEEIVTAGGVCLDEVDSKTMESKLQKGLYWVGEVLDLDGFTGGYNLQAAWSTGFVAGSSVGLE
ncbi:MAG: NAD(P)/FAD-dependent oxidoreductase [Candidatus Caenarcaniphilales bacterium]|nr:NAD(P)/FAD-dependent oxidoreductase [Candidatus Caenarcaniphilales bacterium]